MKSRRKRYLRFCLHQDGSPINGKQLTAEVRRNLLSLYGEVAVADSRLYLSKYNEDSGMGILQCNAALLEKVITSAVLIGSIEKTRVSFEPKKTSGTLKGLKT
ncbi:MAG: Rpp14/Pop5 family protein [Candidatus Thorarchaeota archaeon]|jgi:RNase P/RNase MRP subunit POP5